MPNTEGIDFASLLNHKYAIQQQQADTEGNLRAAQAGLLGAQTTALPQTTASEIGLRSAQAGLTGAQTNLTNVNASILPQTAASEIALRGAQAGQASSQSGYYGALADDTRNKLAPANDAVKDSTRNLNAANKVGGNYSGGLGGFLGGLSSFFGGGAPAPGPAATPSAGIVPVSTSPRGLNPDGTPVKLSKGTSRVPGKGDGTVDKVPAKLAPGEAVLNKGAADLAGRDAIEKLNARGLLHMGMTNPKVDPNQTVPEGTTQALKTGGVVKPVAKGKGKPPSPEELAILMQMMHAHGQGMGMTAGGAPPMAAGMPPGMPPGM